ncbi:MAG: DUF6259 domain-containing protein [bacterium]|jgi:hypothetical protein|nr:DUF6259 domain-containing protein [bacterium]
MIHYISSVVISFSLYTLLYTLNPVAALATQPSTHFSTAWTLENSTPEEWIPQTSEGTLQQEEQHLVAELPAHCTASWVLTIEPVWVNHFSTLRYTYRAQGITNHASQPVLQIRPGSIGPVTPGAKNIENPMARAGECPVILPRPSLQDGAIHSATTTVYPPIQTEQIDQIVLTLHTAEQPGRFELLALSFEDPSLPGREILSFTYLQPISDPALWAGYQSIPLQAGEIPLDTLSPAAAGLPAEVTCHSIPFRLPANRLVPATSLADWGTIEIPINQSCATIYLLMACPVWGSDGQFSYIPRTSISQPERLLVTKRYKDGTIEKSFPRNLSSGAYVVDATSLSVYCVPVQPGKQLQSIMLDEYISYGQLVLLGITTTNHPLPTLASKIETPAPVTKPITTYTPTVRVEETGIIHLETGLGRAQITPQQGGRWLQIGHEMADRPVLQSPAPLFSLQDHGAAIAPETIQFVSQSITGADITFSYTAIINQCTMAIAIHLSPRKNSELWMQCEIQNKGSATRELHLTFPALPGLQLSDYPSDDYYLFPRRPAALGNQPVRLQGDYSGAFPLQFMDLFSPGLDGGLALHTRDTDMAAKRYRMEKSPSASSMSIEYGFEAPLIVAPGQSFTTPLTVLEFHSGDWHTPFHTYKTWSQTWYSETARTRNVLKDLFLCRRDYPIGGTGYLFDLASNAYTFPHLVEESLRDLGGIDMIDISGWAYSETKGRVGSYEDYELGGKENLRQGIEWCRTQGIPVGLYFEGYLIDPRSDIGKAHGQEWQIQLKDGSLKHWEGNEEMYMCSGVPAWQTFFSQTLHHVAQDTGADAVYTDQIGFSDSVKTCYATHHGHHPGTHPVIHENQMLQVVRHALQETDHPVAIYMEQTPVDVSSQYGDAAFDYSFYGVPYYTSPAYLNLFRFAFPSFKIVQLFHAGIDPRATDETFVKLCLFHGEAMWLKGRAKSWYSAKCRAFIRQAYQTYHAHRDAFASTEVEPFLPTMQPGLYANRFATTEETVITLYNETPHTVSGALLQFDSASPDWNSELELERAQLKQTETGWVLEGVLHPHGLGCFVLKN